MQPLHLPGIFKWPSVSEPPPSAAAAIWINKQTYTHLSVLSHSVQFWTQFHTPLLSQTISSGQCQQRRVETMHLFLNFLAKWRICQTVCACVSVGVHQSTYIMFDTDTLGGKKEESDSGLKRDEKCRPARQKAHPWELTHPLFVQGLSLMHWRVDIKHRATGKVRKRKKL